MGLRSLAVVVLLASVAGACALVDPVDSRYDTVTRSLAKARNESIFLNLVRASHDYPLSFTAIGNVTPTMTNTTSLALPTFLFGPRISMEQGGGAVTSPLFTPGRDIIFGNTTASNSTAVGSNFSISTQETSAFYIGFLKPVDLQVLDYFIHQGYSRELLFWLFADTIDVTLGGHTLGMRYDPPNDYGCDPASPKPLCFSDFIVIAIGAGMTIEEVTVESAGGGAKGSGGGASKGDSSGGASKAESTIYARICFDPVLGRQAQRQMPEKWKVMGKFFNVSLASPKCGSRWDPSKDAAKPQPDTLDFAVGPYQFKIVPRSAYGVFEFLGALMKLARQQNAQSDQGEQAQTPFVPRGRDDIRGPPLLATVHDDPNLVTVLQQNDAPLCFVHTWFYDGDYCVPENATTTKQIFSLLAQLIAIQTAAEDLSITPLVRVVQ